MKHSAIIVLTILIGIMPGICCGQDVSAQNLSGKVAFQSDRDGDWEIYIMNIDGSNLTQLTYNSSQDEYPVWSPDGEQIAFHSDRAGNYNIYVMNADGTNQRAMTNLPGQEYDPAWSPDGQRLAFDSDQASNLETYVVDLATLEITPITRSLGKNILPAWSPDGTKIAYTGNRYMGWNVHVKTIATDEDVRITAGHGACRPDWSPDGQTIAYVSQEADGKGDVWLMKPDGSEKTRLTYDNHNYDYYPEWSPDGRHILYAKTSDKETGNWELYIIATDGSGQEIQLTDHPARDKFPNWAVGHVPEDILQRQQFVYEAENSPRTLGSVTIDADASEGKAAYASKDDPKGTLVYGPYEQFPPGAYVATFYVKISRPARSRDLLALDVAANTGGRILAQHDLQRRDFRQNDQYQAFELPFSLSEATILEFRVHVYARADVWVDRVIITRQPQNIE